jgi:hypothetical protein
MLSSTKTGVSHGAPLDVLKSPKYLELQNLNFFYFEATETLFRTSEAMASSTAAPAAESARANEPLLSPPAFPLAHPLATGLAALQGCLAFRRSVVRR